MDSLHNEQHKGRLQLFFAISLMAYFFWFSQLPPPVQTDSSVSAESVANNGTVVNPATTGTPLNSEIPSQNQKVDLVSKSSSTIAYSMEVSSLEGSLSAVHFNDYTVLPTIDSWWGWLISGKGDWQPYSGGDDALEILSKEGQFLSILEGGKSVQNVYQIESITDTSIVTTANISGMIVQKTYTFPSEPQNDLEKYSFDVAIQIKNTRPSSISDLSIAMFDKMDGGDSRFSNVFRPQFYVEEELVGTFGTMFSTSFLSLDELDEATVFNSEPNWFGIGSRYFLSALYPSEVGTFKSISTLKMEGDLYGVQAFLNTPIDPGATRDIKLKAYMGPKQNDILELLGNAWTESIEYGMFGFFSRVLLFMLKVIQSGFTNWGVSILLLTLVVKVIFFPLTQKAFLSGKKMSALQPRLKEIQEKYKDNQQLLAQETMKLFSENDVSPLGGCLPTLVQIPVWFSLYNVMLYSVELYDSRFLYLEDLTSADPYGVLPILYCVLMLIQQRMMPMGNMDPAQQQMLKIMPIAFGIFMFTFPSGLVLYFSMNILLTIFQQWLIRVQFDESTLLKGTEV